MSAIPSNPAADLQYNPQYMEQQLRLTAKVQSLRIECQEDKSDRAVGMAILIAGIATVIFTSFFYGLVVFLGGIAIAKQFLPDKAAVIEALSTQEFIDFAEQYKILETGSVFAAYKLFKEVPLLRVQVARERLLKTL